MPRQGEKSLPQHPTVPAPQFCPESWAWMLSTWNNHTDWWCFTPEWWIFSLSWTSLILNAIVPHDACGAQYQPAAQSALLLIWDTLRHAGFPLPVAPLPVLLQEFWPSTIWLSRTFTFIFILCCLCSSLCFLVSELCLFVVYILVSSVIA